MDDIPDWLRHWLALKAIERSSTWFWNAYGRMWWKAANHELLRLFIWCHIMVLDTIEAINTLSDQKELEPATSYNVLMDDMRSGAIDAMPEINPYEIFGTRFFGASKQNPYPFVRSIVQDSFRIKPTIKPYASLGNIIPRSLKSPIFNPVGSFTRFDNVYPFVRLRPMIANYRLPVFSGVRSFLSRNYPIIDFKPQLYPRVFHSTRQSNWMPEQRGKQSD